MSNYPDGGKNDPRASYNQEPPVIEKIVVDVTVGVTIEVPEGAEYHQKNHAIAAALERGEFGLLGIEHEEVIDTRQA